MFNTLLRFGVAVAAVALMVSVASTASRAYADNPDFSNADLTGIGDLGEGLDAVAKLPPAEAAPPAATVEQPAGTTVGTTGSGAPASESVPAGGAAPHTLALPNTGTGGPTGGDLPLLALAVAVAGFACAGAAFTMRADGLRA